MNSHLLTQEERDYFINLYREYGISTIGIEDLYYVSLSKEGADKLGMGKALFKLIAKMEEILFRLEFHFTITILEVDSEVEIDLRIYGNGIIINDEKIEVLD